MKARKSKEQDALILLGHAQRAYQAEIEKKSNLLGILNEILNPRLPNHLMDRKKALHVGSLVLEQSYLVGVKQKIVHADQAIMRAHKKLQKEMKSYLLARKESLAMEVLFRKAHEEYARDLRKKEQKEWDDLAVMRFQSAEELP